METDEGHRRLAGFLIRRYADRMESNTANDRTVVHLRFDH